MNDSQKMHSILAILFALLIVSCGVDPDVDTGGDGGTGIDIGEEDTDDADEPDSEPDIEDTEDGDIGDVEPDVVNDVNIDVSDAATACFSPCDCAANSGAQYCRRPPGVCFPVSLPSERQYCCTQANCPSGEDCEFADGSPGTCE